MIATTIVAVSLFTFGSFHRRVVPSQIADSVDKNLDSKCVAMVSGWPIIHTANFYYQTGSSASWGRATFGDAGIQWWYDNGNKLCWACIALFTTISHMRTKPNDHLILQLNPAGVFFPTIFVVAFVVLGGLQPRGPMWIFLIPITYGVACTGTELVSMFLLISIRLLNSYVYCLNAMLRYLGYECFVRPFSKT